MGLASALNTALTGMSAAETHDRRGRQQPGQLADRRLQGVEGRLCHAVPADAEPGLGADRRATAARTRGRSAWACGSPRSRPNFTQGTIEISSSPSDLAIQGDGFFIVEDNGGEQLYTRNGIFKTNADNELVDDHRRARAGLRRR